MTASSRNKKIFSLNSNFQRLWKGERLNGNPDVRNTLRLRIVKFAYLYRSTASTRMSVSIGFLYISINRRSLHDHLLSKFRRVSPELHSHHSNVITVSTTLHLTARETTAVELEIESKTGASTFIPLTLVPLLLLRCTYADGRERLRKRKRMRTSNSARLSFPGFSVDI